MKASTLLILFIIAASFQPAFCQDKEDYAAADKLAKEANQQLIKGEVRIADSLIRKSIALYPTLSVFDYALTRGELPDMAGSNLIMDMARIKVLTFKKPRIWIDLPFKGLAECDRQYAYFGFLLKAYEVNKAFGVRSWMEYSLTEASKVPVREAIPNSFDYYVAMQQVLRVELLCLQQKYRDAVFFIQNAPPNSVYGSWESKAQSIIPILCEMGDYQGAVQQINILGTSPLFKNAANSWLFYINAVLKKTTLAMQHYHQLPPEFVNANMNANYYVLGLIDIQDKKYEEAIHKLQISVSKRGKKGNEVYMLVEKWKVYKAMGDAYAGLKLYGKAKDNYQVALLAYPGYEPALTSLAALEKSYAGEIATDKTPPVVSLLEPSPQRGLVVTSTSTTALVKGFASDPSGIRSILINGQDVYNQEDGNFWGEVVLKEGLNKITIVATDVAGNKSEQVYELEKKQGLATAAIPVKEGKNYALLVAAQNYKDGNIPSLENPVADAVKLKLILKNDYNFSEDEIITLFNPETNDIRRQLLELNNTIRPEDNLVIFYAGHGIWSGKEKKGYWMLTDAKLDDNNTWLSNKEMLEMIARLPARHTLLITDACFSGSVFKTRGLNADMPVSVQQLNEKISRVAITSGNDTEVPDKSVFMKYLVKALSENKDKYMTAQKMFINHIIEAVMTETKTEPRYGTLELAGHMGGDFIFMRK